LVPRYPGVTSALGCVIADVKFDRVHTINTSLEELDIRNLISEIEEIAGEGRKSLAETSVTFEETENLFELDMLYVGQTHTVAVRLPVKLAKIKTDLNIDLIRSAFESTYRKTFGRLLDNIGMRVLNLRVTVVGRRPKFNLSILGPSKDCTIEEAKIGTRKVWVNGAWSQADVFDRLDLPKDAVVSGPALLEQPDTTIFIEPDLKGIVDEFGNLVISRKKDQ